VIHCRIDDGVGDDLAALGRRTKADLQRECARRGIVARASWTKAQLLGALAAHAGVVHLSADTPDALDAARGAGVSRRLRATARRLRAAGVRVGVNLMLVPRHARDLRRSLDAALELGASSVTLLRPKGDWAREHCPGFPTAAELRALARALRAFLRERPGLRLSVDTALRREWALAGLLDDPEPNVLGCGGAQRHVALTPEGDVYPCSHARRPGYAMGNLLADDPSTIWAPSQGAARYLAACQGERCPCSLAPDANATPRARRRLPIASLAAGPAPRATFRKALLSRARALGNGR
jgi:MoaA/NifB/PqqE/SkfB family radical SAM enzyme